MYESPLKVDDLKLEINPLDKAIKDAAASIADQFDNYVIRAVAKTGITVNREELLKALRYDRNQYSKGHEDGMKDGIEIGTPKWIPVEQELPEEDERVLCFCRANIYCVLSLAKHGWLEDGVMVYKTGFVTHWMPLPKPPEECEA